MREQLNDSSSPAKKKSGDAFGLISNVITTPLGYLAAVTMFGMLLLTLVNVIQREITGQGIDATIEVTEVFMVVAIFAAMAIAQKDRTHIATSFVTSAMPTLMSTALNRVIGILGAAVLAMFILSAYDVFMTSVTLGEYTIGIARVDLWPGRLVIFVGLIVYMYEYLRVIAAGPSQRSVAEEAEHELKNQEQRERDV